MASSNAANLSKIQQYSQRRFAESNPRTLVGLHKTDVQLKKMVDSLEHQQTTAISNIANHQQAMKMSWRRLEERRSTSPLMTRVEKKREQARSPKRGMLLQSNTKLYVEQTPDLSGSNRPTTVDDSLTGRSSAAGEQGHFLHLKPPKVGPPPSQLTRAHTSPYISSPLNFRKKVPGVTQEQDSDKDGSDTDLRKNKLSDPQDLSASTSQPMVIKSSALNSKETLLRASTLMDMKSTSTGSAGFKEFYSERPRSQSQRAAPPFSPLLVTQQLESAEGNEPGEDEVAASSSLPSLADQFEQIKNCKYIRHSHRYNPERAAEDY